MAKKKLTEEMVDLIENALEERKPDTDRRGPRKSDKSVENQDDERRKGKDRRDSEQ